MLKSTRNIIDKIIKEHIDLNQNDVYKNVDDVLSTIKETYQIRFDNRKNSLKNRDINFDIIETYIVLWGLLSLHADELKYTKNSPKLCNTNADFIIKSIISNITNDIIAIYELLLLGFKYQSNIIYRNLVELLTLLAASLIDEDKMIKYSDSLKNDDFNTLWRDEFSYKVLNNIISKYEKDIFKNEKQILNKMLKWHKKIYRTYSAYVHNSSFECVFGGYNMHGESLVPNVFGDVVDEINEQIADINQTLYYFNLLFFHLLISKLKFEPDEKPPLWQCTGVFKILIDKIGIKAYKE